MSPLAALVVIAALSPSGTWAGASAAAPAVSMTLKGGTVVEARAWTSNFNCELGGPVGPAEVKVRPRARVSRSGLISFNSGNRTRRLKAKLRYRSGKISGRIRIVGNIAGPCSSPAVPITLTRR
jgi:hypothetical protein